MIERKALIFSIQKYNMYDGPGVRTMVFFKGCPLRCKWCSNPEGQLRKFQVMYKKDLCIHCGACVSVCPAGVHAMVNNQHSFVKGSECIGCRKCEEVCPKKVLRIAGEQKSISELLRVVEEDKTFYDVSGGGLTMGGGEALMQPEAATSLAMACKQKGISTAVETCGYAKPEVIARISEFIDYFLYDVKHMDSAKHHELTGVHNELILQNLQWLLENKHNVKIRLPLLKGYNDGEDELKKLIQFLLPYKDDKNFQGVDVLPYHKMGINKFNQLDWDYAIKDEPALTEDDLARIEGYFKAADFAVSIVRH